MLNAVPPQGAIIDIIIIPPIYSFLGKFLNKCMRPLFNVPGEGAFAFLMGIISGYPVGAKIVTNFRNEGICTKYEAERLLCFTNNSGPLFILGSVGISMFADTTTGVNFFLHLPLVFVYFADGSCNPYKNSV